MKKEYFKSIIKQAIQEYLQQSGLQKILLSLYKSSKDNRQLRGVSGKTKNYIQMLKNQGVVQSKTKKHVNRKPATVKTKNSLIKQLKEKYKDIDLQDQEQPLYKTQVIQQEQDLEEQEIQQVNPKTSDRILRRYLNQKLEPQDSILSVSNKLPDFLKKALNKVKDEQ